MSTFFACPYLGAEVELTEERAGHIERNHSEVLPGLFSELEETIRQPDMVLTRRDGERAFVRGWPEALGGNQLLVVVVTDPVPSMKSSSARHWVVTAYIVRRLPKWKAEWVRS